MWGLRPLLRYSDWRGAWILRGIGEDFGPVMVRRGSDAAGQEQPKRSRLGRKRQHGAATERPVSELAAGRSGAAGRSEQAARRPRLTQRQRELQVLPLRANPREPRRTPPSRSQNITPRRSEPGRAHTANAGRSDRARRPRSARAKARRGPRLNRRGRPRSRLGRPRLGSPSRAALVGAGVVLLAAGIGAAVLLSAAGTHRPRPRSASRLTAGVLEFPVSSGWTRAAPTAAATLGLVDGVVLRTTPDASGSLIVGRAASANGTLPPQLSATISGTPAPELVTLGGARYYRYLDLSPSVGGASEAVYTLPTTAGTIFAVCVNHLSRLPLVARCERELSAARLAAGAIAANPQPSYAAAFTAVIRKLDAVRISGTQRLSNAGSPQAQAAAAATLAAAHREAAGAIEALDAGSAAQANAQVASTIRVIGGAYQALGQAVSRGDGPAYVAASTKISQANADLSSAFARLRALGYQVQ